MSVSACVLKHRIMCVHVSVSPDNFVCGCCVLAYLCLSLALLSHSVRVCV